MSDMGETLQELVNRRVREIGIARRGHELSLHEAWLAIEGRLSYETVRRIANGQHRNISDDTADALATMLDVNPSVVLRAAGLRPRLGRFSLPRRADRLSEDERKIVIAVADAILSAAERGPDGRKEIRLSDLPKEEQELLAKAAYDRNVADYRRSLKRSGESH